MKKWWQKPYVSEAQKQAKLFRSVRTLSRLKTSEYPVHFSSKGIESELRNDFWNDSRGYLRGILDNRFFSDRFGALYSLEICRLEVFPGKVSAAVFDQEIFEVEMSFNLLAKHMWSKFKHLFQKQVPPGTYKPGGKLTQEAAELLSDPNNGLLPAASEVSYTCTCPEWNGLCKHIAAVFYDLGRCLDESPDLIFRLLGVDPAELMEEGVDHLAESLVVENSLEGSDLGAIFGVVIDSLGNIPGIEPAGPAERETGPAADPPAAASLPEEPEAGPKADVKVKPAPKRPKKSALPETAKSAPDPATEETPPTPESLSEESKSSPDSLAEEVRPAAGDQPQDPAGSSPPEAGSFPQPQEEIPSELSAADPDRKKPAGSRVWELAVRIIESQDRKRLAAKEKQRQEDDGDRK
jgi:uncharacterized Zn finger protein